MSSDNDEVQENFYDTKRGYYITTKTLEGGRKGVILVMKLAEIKNNVARFQREGIQEESLDAVVMQDELRRQQAAFQAAMHQQYAHPPYQPPHVPPRPRDVQFEQQQQQQRQQQQNHQNHPQQQQQNHQNHQMDFEENEQTGNNYIMDDETTIDEDLTMEQAKNSKIGQDLTANDISLLMNLVRLSKEKESTPGEKIALKNAGPRKKVKKPVSEEDASTVVEKMPSDSNITRVLKMFQKKN